MTVSGHELELNFYSNPIGILIDFGRTVYVNWSHYCEMIDKKPVVDPFNFRLRHSEDDTLFIPMTYLSVHEESLLKDVDPIFAALVTQEFTSYIIKELAVVRGILPLIEMDYLTYDTGILEHNDEQYILSTKIDRIALNARIPADVPRFPAVVDVKMPITGMESLFGQALFERKREVHPTVLPVWLIELSSLPYILRSSRESQPSAMTNIVEKYGLPEKQRFSSPGIVGEHHCEFKPGDKVDVKFEYDKEKGMQVTNISLSEDDISKKTEALLRDESMSWVGLAWAGHQP